MFSTLDRASTGHSGWTHADGWFLYGRVASIADCSRFTPPAGTQRLCQPPGALDKPPIYYVWGPRSPAGRMFNGPYSTGSSQVLHRFAVATIEGRPGAYAALVAVSVPGAAILTIASGFLFGAWLGSLAARGLGGLASQGVGGGGVVSSGSSAR